MEGESATVKHSTMLTGNSWLKSISKLMSEKYFKTHVWKVFQNSSLKSMSNPCQIYKKTFFSKNHCAFFILVFLYYTIQWALEMSKNESIAALKVVVKLDVSLHARQGFWYFLVPDLQYRGSWGIIVNFPYSCILIWSCKCYM